MYIFLYILIHSVHLIIVCYISEYLSFNFISWCIDVNFSDMETDDSKTLATEATKATETSTKSEPKTPLVSMYVLYGVAENVGFFCDILYV